jgi:hypothetical protein
MSADALEARAASNENRLREINEQMEASNAAHHWVDPPYADWACECAREECSEPVQLTVQEYEAVRDNPSHFLVAPSEEHVTPAVEKIVERYERYWVVEKRGVAGDVSEDLDPRSNGH